MSQKLAPTRETFLANKSKKLREVVQSMAQVCQPKLSTREKIIARKHDNFLGRVNPTLTPR